MDQHELVVGSEAEPKIHLAWNVFKGFQADHRRPLAIAESKSLDHRPLASWAVGVDISRIVRPPEIISSDIVRNKRPSLLPHIE